MTKQEETFSKELIKDLINISLLKKKKKSYQKKTFLVVSNFNKKLDKVFNPIFKIVNLNNQFLYKINYPKSNKLYSIHIFKYNKEKQPELFLEINLHNLPKHIEDNTNNIYLTLNPFKLKSSYEELLENNIFLGKISQSLFENKTSFLTKINKASIIYLNQLKFIYPKYISSIEQITNFQTRYINRQWPNFIKCLKEGIPLNLTNSIDPQSLPLSLTTPEGLTISNIIKIKLLNDNELLVTSLEDVNSLNKTDHTLTLETPYHLQMPIHFLLFFKSFGYYKLPNIYAKVYEKYKSTFQKYLFS